MGNEIREVKGFIEAPTVAPQRFGSFLQQLDIITCCCGLVASITDDAGWFLQAWNGKKTRMVKAWDRLCDLSWVISLVCVLVMNTLQLLNTYDLEKEATAIQEGEEEEESRKKLANLQEKRRMLLLANVKSLFDFPVATTFAFDLNTSKLVIGVFGIVSSFLSLYKHSRAFK